MTPFVIVGVILLAVFVLYALADGERIPNCVTCGHPSASPAHYDCRGARCPARFHHAYQTPDWPFGLLAGLMLLDVVAWAAASFLR
jgi:hypothetical protein